MRLAAACACVPLAGCAIVVGPCELTREPQRERVACQFGGQVIVMPVRVLQAAGEVMREAEKETPPEGR